MTHKCVKTSFTLDASQGWRLSDKEIEQSKQHDIIVPYGSQIFCEVIAQQLNLKLKLNSFDWLAKIPYDYVARKIKYMTLAEAIELNKTERKFIKPADDKCFDAKVYEPNEFKPHELIDRNYPTLVSDPVKFVSEYRFFVKDQKILTGSCYLWNGEINEPKNYYNRYFEMLQYACWCIKQIPSESAVIDFGFLDDTDEMVIIESNPAWASGIYGCDLEAVLEVFKDSVIRL
jgi:hypothetical protein